MTLLAGRAITKSFGSRLLETALEEFTGTVVAISHDRYFLDRVADRIVEVDGSVRATDGGYSAWLERKRAAVG